MLPVTVETSKHGILRKRIFSYQRQGWSQTIRGIGDQSFAEFNSQLKGEAPWLPIRRASETVALVGSVIDKHEKLWRDFLADPSKWWDNRLRKSNPSSPDFKHKQTGNGLWLGKKCTPAWVESEITAMQSDVGHKKNWKESHDKLWQQLFSDPSQWWDHRPRKGNAKFPDFLHKQSGAGLWLDGRRTPSWISSRIASLGPGTLQPDVISSLEKLSLCNKAGNFARTLQLFKQMEREGIGADFYSFLHVLNACSALGALKDGRDIHRRIVAAGCELHPHISSTLVDMYAKCGSLEDARNVFDQMHTRGVVAWTALMLGYVKCGQGSEALELFRIMQQENVKPDSFTFVALLNACASTAALEEGRRIHKQIIQSGCESSGYIRNSLVDMYTKCGSLEDARRVFDQMSTRDVVVWTSMILGCVKCGQGREALELFRRMERERVEPNSFTFVALLNACASLKDLEEGRQAHKYISQRGWESHSYVGNALVDMYAKCGSLEDARDVFFKMPTRDVVAWTAMILGCVNLGQGPEALELFRYMQQERVVPNSFTFVVLVNACANMMALEEGRLIHKQIVQSGFETDAYVGSSLVDMYAKCGSLDDARSMFIMLPSRDVVVWTAMIVGCVNCGQEQEALELFEQMQKERVEPNSITFVGLLNACAGISALEDGRRIHKQTVQCGFETDAYVGSALVDMYSKCGSLGDALNVFYKIPVREVVAWTSMIQGCVKCGEGQKALDLFRQMQLEKVEPDSFTFVALLSACASMSALEEGRLVHKQIVQSGFESHSIVGSSLVDMYAKCGSLGDARIVFENMPSREVIAWSAMMLGYVKCGQGLEALNLFQQMHQEGVEPDSLTFVLLFNACASMAALEEGRRLHQQILHKDFESNLKVCNSLIDMYAKCGSIEEALKVFDKMPTRDVVSWNLMMMGFATHGLAKEAVALFEQMSLSGSEMNEVTFLCVLSACSHGCQVKRGLQYFGRMSSVYGVAPTQEHYTIMVDILGRAGHLDDAEAMINSMPIEPCAATWMSLLGSCRIHGNVEMAERAFEQVVKLDPTNAAGYVLLSNIRAAASSYESKDLV